MKQLFLAIFFIANTPYAKSQEKDSLKTFYPLNAKNLIIPSAAIAYGFMSLKIEKIKEVNFHTRHEIKELNPDHISLDNYTQYTPAALVYGLNAFGIKGKHNFKDRTVLYATSQLISGSIVMPLKYITQEKRPDGSNKHSFPSGHTATAFSSAHFMFKEYKDSNFWLSLSGYPFAVFTGVYRTLNDKHWVGDVIAGAGIGILSTELAYCIYPVFKRSRTKNKSLILPTYNYGAIGLSYYKSL